MEATRGVAGSMLQLLEEGATHVGIATDHIIPSFRNELYDGYKDGRASRRSWRRSSRSWRSCSTPSASWCSR
ncbi:MAG: hypothetical protein R2702_05290 [Acidimicrobiales bacterium]